MKKFTLLIPLVALLTAPLAESATAFTFLNPIVAGGSNPSLTDTVTLRYNQADPNNLYDVFVSVDAVVAPGVAAAGTFTNPQVVDGSGETAGLFLTRWDWDDDSGVYTNAQLFTTYTFEVFLTGTNIAATGISLIASSFDNDGTDQATARVREFVVYSPGATFSDVGSTQTELPQSDGRTAFLGPAVIEQGVTDSPDYRVDARYENQSEFTWTSGHLIDGRAANAGPGAARLGALQLSFEPVPEPSTALLSALGICSLVLRRRR